MRTWAGSALWIIAIGVCVNAAPKGTVDIVLFGTLAKTEGNLILNCTASIYSQFFGVNWTLGKNDTLKYVDPSHITTNFTGNRVISAFNTNHKPLHSDIGEYKCVIFNKNTSQPINSTVFHVKAAPFPVRSNEVRRLKEQNSGYVRAVQSIVAKTGQATEIRCEPDGYPEVTITWHRVPFNMEDEDNLINSTLLDLNTNRTRLSHGNKTLHLDDTEETDRGYYVCKAHNKVEPDLYIYTLVRVKSRYAALWPSLVLLGEFVLLGLIIGLCELRRKRSTKDEDDVSKSHTSGNASTSAGHANSSGDVRHRSAAAAKCN